MFLLIHGNGLSVADALAFFTFHYVSINTLFHDSVPSLQYSLHSTMFLLIHDKSTKG